MKPHQDVTLPIVGADYPNPGRGPTRRFELTVTKPGDPVELRPEPKNPYDEHAIAVFSERGVQMGYLPAERAVRIGVLLRQGIEITAVFQEQSAFGGFVRLSFDGSVPDLPPEFSSDPEPDWWPDEEYPDE